LKDEGATPLAATFEIHEPPVGGLNSCLQAVMFLLVWVTSPAIYKLGSKKEFKYKIKITIIIIII